MFKFWKGTVPRLGRLVVSPFFWFFFLGRKRNAKGKKKEKKEELEDADE